MSSPAPELRARPGATWNRRVAVLAFGLLLMLPAGIVAFNYLMPKAPSPGPRTSSRVGWYLQSGQWHADARTLVSAFEFVMDVVPDLPALADSPNEQLAATSKPVGPNSKVEAIVQVRSHHIPNF